MRCIDCGSAGDGKWVGAGDGTGQRFRCGSCADSDEIRALRERLAEAERERDEHRGCAIALERRALAAEAQRDRAVAALRAAMDDVPGWYDLARKEIG